MLITIFQYLRTLYCSKHTQLAIPGILGLACFHPFFFSGTKVHPKSLVENRDTPLYFAMTSDPRSHYFRDTSLIALSLMAPLIVDLLLDAVNFIIKCWSHGWIQTSITESDEKENDDYQLSYMEKTMIFLGLLVIPVIGLLPVGTRYLPELYICGRYAQLNWAMVPYTQNLIRRTSTATQAVSNELLTTFSMMYTVANVIAARAVFNSSEQIHIDVLIYDSPLIKTAKCLIWMSLLGFISLVFYQFFRKCCVPVFLAYFSGTSVAGDRTAGGSSPAGNGFSTDKLNNESITTKDQREYNFFLTLYAVFSTAVMLFVVISSAISWHFYVTDWYGLFIMNVAFISFEANLLVFQMRRTKFKVLIGLHSTIAAKKSYIRYISHELRTPLNAAFLGIKLLSDDFRPNVCSAEDEERMETLTDVSNSCSTAIEILNDLLCLDKGKTSPRLVPFLFIVSLFPPSVP